MENKPLVCGIREVIKHGKQRISGCKARILELHPHGPLLSAPLSVLRLHSVVARDAPVKGARLSSLSIASRGAGTLSPGAVFKPLPAVWAAAFFCPFFPIFQISLDILVEMVYYTSMV